MTSYLRYIFGGHSRDSSPSREQSSKSHSRSRSQPMPNYIYATPSSGGPTSTPRLKTKRSNSYFARTTNPSPLRYNAFDSAAQGTSSSGEVRYGTSSSKVERAPLYRRASYKSSDHLAHYAIPHTPSMTPSVSFGPSLRHNPPWQGSMSSVGSMHFHAGSAELKIPQNSTSLHMHPLFASTRMAVLYLRVHLLLTVEQRNDESNDSSASRVLGPLCSTTNTPNALEDATNCGHSALSRYRKHGGKQDLECSIAEFERALNTCPPNNPCRVAAQSNLAMAKFILCRVDDTNASFEIPLSLYRNALVARPVGHADRASTLIQLAAVYLARFERRRDGVNGVQAEASLDEAMELSSTDSHEKRAVSVTTTTRFIVHLLKFLLKGFVAKDKIVRYRCVHLLTEMVAHLGETDEDVYHILRAALMERIHDKETPIRVQAAVAPSKLCGSEDPSDVEEGEQAAIDVLLDTLSCDPAAEVRRAALLNMPITKYTLPCILARSRDTDTVMRRLVYSAVLEKNFTTPDGSAMGPLHPPVLASSQRELIVRNRLGDREPAVRSAAGSLLGTWVYVVRGSTKAEEGGSVMDDVLAFLGLFDLNENTVAEDALLSIFATRVDIFDQLELEDAFWDTLNPSKAFLGRVYMEHCIATDDQAKLEASLPVVTHLACQTEGVYNKYQEDVDTLSQERALRELDANEPPDHELDDRLDDTLLDAEFVISEMLKLAVDLDYADEIGRRKLFQFVHDTICQEGLPEGLVARCLDVLRVLSPSERDLIRVVVEVVHELRDEREGQEDGGDEGGGS